ncbi:MAG TPA: FAD-dependent oxidoreductase [Tissierellia bacterium]|nr:FAD-dependent oxidoreductase [Tissierellia bacterium]
MARKILIVGGVAGGASAAARLRRLSEEDTIIIFEKGPHVSFSNCSLPYHLSGIVESVEDLLLMDPDLFLSRHNIEVRTDSEVVSIDRKNKEITVKNKDKVYKESYDKLILSPGADPIIEDIEGLENASVFTVKNVVDIDNLSRYIKNKGARNILVIGGGFIGIETAENLKLAGYNVSIVIASKQVLNTYDYDMVQIFHKEIHDKGINLLIGEKVKEIENNKAYLFSGKVIDADAIIMAKGVKPNTSLAEEAGLEIGETGAIKVDKNYNTSDKDIYAVGDAIEVYNSLTHLPMKLSLAGPAQKAARAAADHINNRVTMNKGFIGSSAIKVFDYKGAATGLTESMIKSRNIKIDYGIVRATLSDKVSLMPDAHPLHFKLLYEVPTGRILGAQAIGKGDVTKRIDIIATLIKFNGTLDDLRDLELCYAPPFSTAKDVVNYAGYIGSNLLNGDFKQVNVDQVREIVEKGGFIVDVREKFEYKRGHVKGALNIPLSELRKRYNEIPKDIPVYLYCRSGQRSYNAVMALQNLGYTNVYNIAGSFLDLSFYEYFNDVTTGRERILTGYNFR